MVRGVEKFEAIVFDLDGTLVDSLPDMASALNKLLKDDGRCILGVDEIRPLIGGGVKKMIRSAYSLTGKGITSDKLPYASARYLAYYKEFPDQSSKLYAGIIETLDYFQTIGVKMGVCSNKAYEMVNCILEAFDLIKYFCGVTGGDSVVYNKPDGRHILETLKKMNVLGKNVVMVGDTSNDILAATDAGLLSVGVNYGYSDPDELLSATVIIDQFEKLKNIKI